MAYTNKLIGGRPRKYYFFIVVLLPVIFVPIFINLGAFLDITEEPQKADLVVYLGGGGLERMEKTLELCKLDYPKASKMIFTSSPTLYTDKKIVPDKKLYFAKYGILERNLVHIKKVKNTMEETLFVKNYMLQYNLESVIFVSDPPHSIRVIFLTETISDYDEAALSCSVVGSDVNWWDKKHYCRQSKAIVSSVYELI